MTLINFKTYRMVQNAFVNELTHKVEIAIG